MDKLSSYILRVDDYKDDGYFRIPQYESQCYERPPYLF
jgi:hypothetical protein